MKNFLLLFLLGAALTGCNGKAESPKPTTTTWNVHHCDNSSVCRDFTSINQPMHYLNSESWHFKTQTDGYDSEVGGGSTEITPN